VREEPANAPAHRERPTRARSDLAESPAGRDAVARWVRVVFAPRLFPHFLSPLALSLRRWLPLCACVSSLLPPHSVRAASTFIPCPRSLWLWGSGVVVAVVVGVSGGASSFSFVWPSTSFPRLRFLFFCGPPRVSRGLLSSSSLTLPRTASGQNRGLSDLAESPAGRDAVARRVRLVFAVRLFPHSLSPLALFRSLRLALRTRVLSLESFSLFLPLRPSLCALVRHACGEAQELWLLSLWGSLAGLCLPFFCVPPRVLRRLLSGASLTPSRTASGPNVTLQS